MHFLKVCKQENGGKLFQLSGEPYDFITLATVELPSSLKNQFNICEACSIILTLYSHLHHQKYNFFIKCRTKVSDV